MSTLHLKVKLFFLFFSFVLLKTFVLMAKWFERDRKSSVKAYICKNTIQEWCSHSLSPFLPSQHNPLTLLLPLALTASPTLSEICMILQLSGDFTSLKGIQEPVSKYGRLPDRPGYLGLLPIRTLGTHCVVSQKCWPKTYPMHSHL